VHALKHRIRAVEAIKLAVVGKRSGGIIRRGVCSKLDGPAKVREPDLAAAGRLERGIAGRLVDVIADVSDESRSCASAAKYVL